MANAALYSLIKSAPAYRVHCNENPIYVFPFWESCGLSPNFHIHVSVSYLYVPRISPHISCSRIGRSRVEIYKIAHRHMIVELVLWPRYSFSGNICFKFSVLVLCRPPSENLRIRVIFVLHLALLPYCIKVDSMVLLFYFIFRKYIYIYIFERFCTVYCFNANTSTLF
jgi:hypothetical protein